LVSLVAAAYIAAGCSQDTNARHIVEQGATDGRMAETLAGPDQNLVKNGKISSAVEVPAADGVTLNAWVMKARNSKGEAVPAKGTVVVIHSLGKSHATFPFMGVGERLAKLGYDVVLPDLRAHGRSGGKYVTFGVLEKQDLKAVLDSLISRKEVSDRVYVYGENLGGMVAIEYAAIDPRCQGVIAVAPFKDIDSWARGVLAFWAPTLSEKDFQATLARAGEIGGFNPKEASAIDAVAKIHCPILLIQAPLDISVPLFYTSDIYAKANEPKKLLIPVLEQIALPAVLEDWLASQIDQVAQGKIKELKETPPATPAK
jgi:pimeloyl-ACP methyl ester carboxylesterase